MSLLSVPHNAGFKSPDLAYNRAHAGEEWRWFWTMERGVIPVRNSTRLLGIGRYQHVTSPVGASLSLESGEDGLRVLTGGGSGYTLDGPNWSKITGYPFTILCLGTTVDEATNRVVFDWAHSGTNDTNYMVGTSGVTAVMRLRNGTGFTTRVGFTDISGKPHLIAMVCHSATLQELVVDGVVEATSTNNIPFTNQPDRAAIGRLNDSTPGDFAPTRFSYVALLQGAASLTQLRQLAADYAGPFRLDYSQFWGKVPAGAPPGGLSIPVAMYNYRRRRVA